MNKINLKHYNLDHRKIKGFSLVELMATVAIIGILSSIAIPNYMNYTARARVSNAMSALEGLKKTASENYMSNNVFPTLASPYIDDMISSSKISPATSYGSITTIANSNENIVGYVQITFSSTAPTDLRGKILALVALESTNMIRWQCVNGDATGNNLINTIFLPTVCR